MRKRLIIVLAASAGLTAAAAFAAGDPAPKAPDSQRICREPTRELGSHIRTPRRCRTAEQWRQEDERSAQTPATLRVTEGQNDGRVSRAPH